MAHTAKCIPSPDRGAASDLPLLGSELVCIVAPARRRLWSRLNPRAAAADSRRVRSKPASSTAFTST